MYRDAHTIGEVGLELPSISRGMATQSPRLRIVLHNKTLALDVSTPSTRLVLGILIWTASKLLAGRNAVIKND